MSKISGSSILETPSPLAPENLAESFFHKLSQPIGALYASLELGLMSDDSKQLKAAIEAGLTQLERLRWLFQAAREFFTIDFAAKERKVSLRECVEAAVKDAEPLAESRQVHFSFSAREDAEVLADPVYLRDAIENVLSRCVRNSAPGAKISLRVAIQANANSVVISDQVRFDSQSSHSVFEPFPPGVQIGPGQPGNLDLALSQKIIQAFGGELTLKASSTGTDQFEITLPRHNS
jgi:signal transduction histidine kinase